MTGMPSRDEMLAHYATTSGRQVDDIDYYCVLAKWKLAVVLEQGYQRAGDDEKLQAFGPVVLELMQAAADLAETTDYSVLATPGSTDRRIGTGREADMRAALCRTYGGPEVVEVADVPAPALGAGQVRVRVHVGAINFPDVLVIANTYQMSAPTPFITGSEFAGVVTEVGDGVEGLAVGDRVFGSCFVGAFAEEVVVGAGGADADPGRGGRPHGRRLRRRLQDGVPRAALGGGPAAGRGARRARRRRRRRLGRGAARRRAGRHGDRRRLDTREARGGPGLRRAAADRPPRRRPAPGPARRPARRRRRRHRPGRGRPGRAGPALAALRRPLRHRGLRRPAPSRGYRSTWCC